MQVELANPWMLAFYVVAMIAICWHFSTASGFLPPSGASPPAATARKRFGYVCAALGFALTVMGLASIWAFVGGKYPNVPEDQAGGLALVFVLPGHIESDLVPNPGRMP